MSKTKLEIALEHLNKINPGSGMKLSGEDLPEYTRIPTGSLGLDRITGGGFPLGRIIELYGGESSGKTSVCLQSIREAQRMGLKCVFIDMEQAFDYNYAKSLGVDVDELYLVQPSCGEEALDAARTMIETGDIGLVIVDSIATLTPKAEVEGDIGDNQMGLQARMMSKGLRMLTPTVNKNDTCVIFTNQEREKIGLVFGNPITTPGGNAMKFYASIRIRFTNRDSKTQQDIDGNKKSKQIGAKCIKNKTFPPFRECSYYIEFGKGIDTLSELIELAVEQSVIGKAGSWYNFEDTKLGQGIESVKTILEDNPELVEEIKSQLK